MVAKPPKLLSGERGIRTPGAVTPNGFQDRRNRPLCHLSGGKGSKIFFFARKIKKTFCEIFKVQKYNILGLVFEEVKQDFDWFEVEKRVKKRRVF